MSDTETLLLAVKLRVRELELEACAVHAKHQEALSMQEMLEQRLQTLGLQPRPRGRPPRNASALNPHPPQMGEARLNQRALDAMYPGQGHANPYPGQILEMPGRVDGGMGEATPEPDSAA